MSKSTVAALVFCSLFLASAFAAEARRNVAPFKDGDRVVFLGDSITHHGRYMEQIALYYATRYPETDVWFSGSGESGGIMDGARRRMGTDVLDKKPTVVTLMFGMNDVARKSWPRTGETEKNRADRRAAADFFETSMEKVVSSIRTRADNPRIVYMTPSPYDQECVVDGKKAPLVCNDGLENLARIVRDHAAGEGAECVDLQEYLRKLNEREQAKDPSWSFMRTGGGAFDRIHPREFGHQFFAYAFLKAQRVPSEVATLAVDAKSGKANPSNADLSDLSVTPEAVSFTALEKALPYPFNEERLKACDYEPIVDDLNREVLCVRGLADGEYAVSIDGAEIGRWNARELGIGVNLAMNPRTPQYAQAQKVMEAMTEQWAGQTLIRDLLMWRLWRKHKGVPVDDMDAYRKWFAETYPDGVKKGDFYGWIAERYLANWERRAEIEAAVERGRAEVRRLAKCAPHRWRIARLPKRNVVAFNEDDTHFLFKFDCQKMTEQGASDYLDGVIGGGKITHFFMCPGAQVANFDSKTRDTLWKHLGEPGYVCYRFATNGCHLSRAGMDAKRIWVDGCRRRGVSPWLSVRMNDMHDANLPLSCLHSDFWREHPEYRFGMGQFDYRFPEVRADMLRFIGECLSRYDVDGVECDWMRWTHHLSDPRRDAGLLTAFMREVRKLADASAAKRGHAVRVGVRVESRPDAAVELGTDAVAWAKEGLVDWIVPCNFFLSVDFDLPVAEWKRLLGPAAKRTLLVAGMDAGKVVWDDANDRWSGRRQLTVGEYCGFADRMYGRGADGISVFNLFTYDHMPRWTDGPWKFVTQVGLDPETVRRHPRSIPEKFFYEHKGAVPTKVSGDGKAEKRAGNGK